MVRAAWPRSTRYSRVRYELGVARTANVVVYTNAPANPCRPRQSRAYRNEGCAAAGFSSCFFAHIEDGALLLSETSRARQRPTANQFKCKRRARSPQTRCNNCTTLGKSTPKPAHTMRIVGATPAHNDAYSGCQVAARAVQQTLASQGYIYIVHKNMQAKTSKNSLSLYISSN